MRLTGDFGLQWPDTPHRQLPRAYSDTLDAAEDHVAHDDPTFQADANGSVNLQVSMKLNASLWGVPAPTIIPMTRYVTSSIDYVYDSADNGNVRALSCATEYQSGVRSSFELSGGLPFNTRPWNETRYVLLDTCEPPEEGSAPDALTCMQGGFDVCEEE